MKAVVILGGYGNAGLAIAGLLYRHTDARMVLAGRNADRARCAAESLNARHGSDRAAGRRCDVLDPHSLRDTLAGAALVVVASSTTDSAKLVAEGAIAAGAGYFDVQMSTAPKWEGLRAVEARAEAAGVCLITDGGYHPGIPAALVRYAAPRLDRIESALTASVMRIPWGRYEFSKEALEEFVREFRGFHPAVYRAGRWTDDWRASPAFDFGQPYGRLACRPMRLEEMMDLPTRFPSIEETGFFVCGFDWLTNTVAIPAAVLGTLIAPRAAVAPLARLFRWSVSTFSKPPYGVALLLEARGVKDGRPRTVRVRISHEDAYLFTAVPAVACVKQYLSGAIGRPGLHCQAHLVEPGAFLDDLEAMGLAVERS